MGDGPKRLPAAFWRSATRVEPVRQWLWTLEKDDRYEIGTAIKTVEFGWPIGMPTCKPMGGGLWEVRASLARGRIARLLFCNHEGQMIRLPPKHDLALARDRKNQLESEGDR